MWIPIPAPARKATATALSFFQEMGERHFSLISAGVAFFAMLAIFPAVAALIALWGYWFDPDVIAAQLELLIEFVPGEAFGILQEQVRRLIEANDSTLGVASLVSILGALWSSRRGVEAMVQGLNAIHGTRGRAGLMPMVRAMVMTVVLIGVGIVSLVSFLIVPIVLALLPLGPAASTALTAARWGIAMGTVAVGLAVLYRHGPNREDATTARILPGLGVAIAGWGAAAFGFSQFLANFGNYNEVYGSIGAVAALMMWFYISAYAVLVGAAVNARLERRQ